jgi:anti-anti-sigma factor
MNAQVPQPPEFSVTTERLGERALVVAAGEVDLHTVGDLEAAVRAELEQRPVVLDLSAVSFMDSSGVRLLDALMRDGAFLTIRRTLQPAVRQVLDMTRMTSVLEFEQP